MRPPRVVLLALALLPLLAPPPAQADTHDSIHQTFAALEQWTDRVADQAQDAILLGGALVAMNRYAISGGAAGCALGVVAGAGSAAALAVPSAGATIAAAPDAMALGCTAGALGGAAFGHLLDHPEGP